METDRTDPYRTVSCIRRESYAAFLLYMIWLYTKHSDRAERFVFLYINDCSTSYVDGHTVLSSTLIYCGKMCFPSKNWVSRIEYALRTGSSQRTFSFRQEIQLIFLFYFSHNDIDGGCLKPTQLTVERREYSIFCYWCFDEFEFLIKKQLLLI